MKKANLKLILSLMLMIACSCGEPDTVVTNIIHADGSVTRKIVMRSDKSKFDRSACQVPFDSTWIVSDSLEISLKGDTTWVKRAEKLFRNVGEINMSYTVDSSVNGKMPRHASFSKKFRWFNTEYRFSETVEKLIPSGYPIVNFLNDDELTHFYSPDYIQFNKESGANSLKYRLLSDSIDKKSDQWIVRNLASIWIDEFSKLVGQSAGPELSAESLKAREGEFISVINESPNLFDSLWTAGVLLKKFIGEENAIKYRTEADSALSAGIEKFLVGFTNYSVRIVMPGKLIRTNGYVDSTKNLLWPVKSDYYITDRYEMWAESKTTNPWAWIVSGLFLVFVAAGIFIKRKPRQ